MRRICNEILTAGSVSYRGREWKGRMLTAVDGKLQVVQNGLETRCFDYVYLYEDKGILVGFGRNNSINAIYVTNENGREVGPFVEITQYLLVDMGKTYVAVRKRYEKPGEEPDFGLNILDIDSFTYLYKNPRWPKWKTILGIDNGVVVVKRNQDDYGIYSIDKFPNSPLYIGLSNIIRDQTRDYVYLLRKKGLSPSWFVVDLASKFKRFQPKPVKEGPTEKSEETPVVTIPEPVIDPVALANQPVASPCADGVLTIPDTTTEIIDEAYIGREDIITVVIPDSVKRIGKSAFRNCSNLESIMISDSVTEIDNGAFEGCKTLKSVDIPQSVTVIGRDVFAYCASLVSVKLNASIKRIEHHTFYSCVSLKEIAVPDSVEYISPSSLEDCDGLVSYVLPESLKYISQNTFRKCPNLREIHSHIKDVNRIPVNYAFNRMQANNGTLYVPEGTLLEYKAHPIFSIFKNIVTE